MELARDYLHRLAEVVGPRAHVQADLARVLIGAGERIHRVGQTAPLAHLLEQPRGRRAAEDRVEHAKREPPVVVAGQPDAAETHVVLLGVLALEAALMWRRARGRIRTVDVHGRIAAYALGHQLHEPVVLDRARGSYDYVRGHVASGVKAPD